VAYLQSYQVVYDVRLEERVSFMPSLAVGALCVLLGLAFVFDTRLFTRDRAELRSVRWLGAAVAAISLLATRGSYVEVRGDAEFRRRLDAGEYTLVEGVVTHYVPGRRDGHGDEEWTVSGGGRTHRYRFSSAVHEGGYGEILGPVKQGSRVRIAEVDGRIARLEVVKWSFQ
jgi:hypothetical protein